MNIPGVTFHSRLAWVSPAYPVDGPRFDPSGVDTFVVHYTADNDLPDGDPGEDVEDIPGYLRGIQRYYETQRGYSIGYNYAVDWLGGVWQLRGVDFRCAANRGWNERSIAVLQLVDGQDPMTPAALEATRRLLAWCDGHVGRTLKVRPHSEVGSTHCPGDGIRRQIPDITPLEGDTMNYPKVIRLNGQNGSFAVWPGHKVWLPDPFSRDVFLSRTI
jgi:hypothetical protein